MPDGIEKIVKDLQEKAAETGTAQSQTISGNGWQPVIRDGKVVGRVRFGSIKITIKPRKKASQPGKKSQTPKP